MLWLLNLLKQSNVQNVFEMTEVVGHQLNIGITSFVCKLCSITSQLEYDIN